MILFKYINIIWMMSIGSHGYFQNKSEWELAKNEKGVTINYHRINKSGEDSTYEMRAIFNIALDTAALIAQFKDPGKLDKWFIAHKETNITYFTDKTWQTYTLFGLPWPFKSKVLITYNECTEKEEYTVIKSESNPQPILANKDISRIQSYYAMWKFIPLPDHCTKVVYNMITYDKPEFPSFIADPILQNAFIQSGELLRTQTSNGQYQ